jgi:hypothetical protein
VAVTDEVAVFRNVERSSHMSEELLRSQSAPIVIPEESSVCPHFSTRRGLRIIFGANATSIATQRSIGF